MASIFEDIWDGVTDYFSGGKESTRDYVKNMLAAQAIYDSSMNDVRDTYAKDVEAAQAKRKSLKEIGAEGKEAAATEASNKAGIAKRNAKAAAMQNSGSRLMSAIQGAQAANDAVSSGFDAAAARNTAMAQGINEADITNALNAAQNKANLASAAAKNKYDTASNIAATKKANADASADRKSQLGNTILQAGHGWLTKKLK